MGNSCEKQETTEWLPEYVFERGDFHLDTFAHEFTMREVFHAYAEVSGTMGQRNEEAL